MKKIALKNFFLSPKDPNLYEEDLGWDQFDYDEAMTSSPEEVLRHYLDVGYDFYFFYPVTMRWYYIDNSVTDRITLSRRRPDPDWDGVAIENNIQRINLFEVDEIPDVIFRCRTIEEFISGADINGVRISDVINRSWIKLS